jgi:tetratricopeptide (TPR) repeat protein
VTHSRPDLWEEVERTSTATTVTWATRRSLFTPGGITGDYGPTSFDFPSASRIIRERIATDPEGLPFYVQTLYRIALLYGSDSELSRAKEELDATNIPPHARVHPRALGDILDDSWTAYIQGDYARSLQLGKRCLDGGGPQPFALGPVGLSYMHLGRHAEADAALREMRAMLPDRLEPRLHLADLRVSEGRNAEALQLVGTVIAQVDTISQIKYVGGLLSALMNRPDAADEAYRLASAAPERVRESWPPALLSRLADSGSPPSR